VTARLLIAVLLASVAIGVVDIDAVAAWWLAMYPSDPEQTTALQLCYIENHQFNRMSADARHDCYKKWLPILAFANCMNNQRCSSNLLVSR
jgi:hypothetical protein